MQFCRTCRQNCPSLPLLHFHESASLVFYNSSCAKACFPSLYTACFCKQCKNLFFISQNHSSNDLLTVLSAFGGKGLVGLSGLEPPTSRLSGVRSNLLSYKPTNGDERGRTADLLLARQALSQLSYTPKMRCAHSNECKHSFAGAQGISGV